MKALCFREHGDLEQIKYEEVPKPECKTNEVLIEIKACALNHLDIWVRRGWPGLSLDKPHWCGADISGVVSAVGSSVKERKVGQRVVVCPGITTKSDEFTQRGEDSLSPHYAILGEHLRGGAAEFIAVPESSTKVMPDELGFAEGAAPLLVTLTAWRMLINRARLKAGESVLIVGAGGGVNTMSIQIAKLAGAKTYVVASNERKAQLAKELGADVVIDRSETNWSKAIYKMTHKRGVDLVVDNVGAATINQSLRAAARGGRIAIVGNTSGPHAEIDLRFIFGKQLEIIGSTMGSQHDFEIITRLLWSCKLKPVIDRTMPLASGKEAYSLMENSEQFGKIVLEP